MTRRFTRRMRPVAEWLEGRALQSGLVAAPEADRGPALMLPYLEQENVRPVDVGRRAGAGGESGIIAILIG